MTTFSNADIRQAILRAADRIEREPKSYNFMRMYTPRGGDVACMWGWVGHELGMQPQTPNFRVASACGIPDGQTGHLYEYCNRSHSWRFWDSTFYQTSAKSAARQMRSYAEKFYPAEKLDPDFLKWRVSFVPRLVHQKESV